MPREDNTMCQKDTAKRHKARSQPALAKNFLIQHLDGNEPDYKEVESTYVASLLVMSLINTDRQSLAVQFPQPVAGSACFLQKPERSMS
jgi:hypothetical protein